MVRNRRPAPAGAARSAAHHGRAPPSAASARRGKYLLFDCGAGTLILHLGMSGRLWVVGDGAPPTAHDHFDLKLENGTVVRLRDPRRFGLVLWQTRRPARAPPAAGHRSGALLAPIRRPWLHRGDAQPQRGDQAGAHGQPRRRGRRQHLRQRSAVSRGHPSAHAGAPGQPARCATLAEQDPGDAELAIGAGGSTLRDYVASDGQAGYFQNQFMVYDRAGEPCPAAAPR